MNRIQGRVRKVYRVYLSFYEAGKWQNEWVEVRAYTHAEAADSAEGIVSQMYIGCSVKVKSVTVVPSTVNEN